jgi:hypothetical protein
MRQCSSFRTQSRGSKENEVRVLVLSGILALLLGACVSPEEYWNRATKPGPDGTVAGEVIMRRAPGVAGNPADVDGWLEVLKAVGYIVVGAGGKTGVDSVRKKRATRNASPSE